MSCGAIWLPFLSTRADDDDAPASFQAMRPDPPPASPAPAAKSAPAEAAPSSPVAIPPLEPRLRIHYDGPLRWNDHPKLTQRVEDATAALEAAGWTSVLQHMPKGVRTPEGVFHFMPTLHAVMNVSGVSRVQLANRLALKRSKQRRALPYPFGAGVSDPVSDPTPDPDPTPVPAVVQEREQLYLGYAWPRESQKFGSMKKLTDSVVTILPGDENALKLGEDDDQSPSTGPSIKRRRVDEPLDESEEREMVRESIRRSLVKHGPRGKEVGASNVDAFVADVMNIETASMADDGLGDDSSPEQGTPVVPTDDDEDEETLAGMLERHRKQIRPKARKARPGTKARARARDAVVETPPPPPPTDAFALPRREPFKIPKIAPAAARVPVESKLPAGDPVRAKVALEEFSNAARAIGSNSHGAAARALTRLAGMNITLEVLFKLGECPKHVKRWVKSGATREIRDAASACVDRWTSACVERSNIARTSQEEEGKTRREEETARARQAPEPDSEPDPDPEPVHHDSRATFASGYYASPDRCIDPEVAYLESRANDRTDEAMDDEEALGRAITALNASPRRKTWAPEVAERYPPQPERDDDKDDEKDAMPRPVLMEVPPPPHPPPPRGSESPPTVREVPPPPPRGRAAGPPPPPGPYGTRESPPTTTAPYLAPPPSDTRDRNVRPGDRDDTRDVQPPAGPASDNVAVAVGQPGEIAKRGADETLPEPRRGDEEKRQSLAYRCATCDCDVPANGREQHETGAKHREKEKDFLARMRRCSDRCKRIVKVVHRAGPTSGDLRDRIDRTPMGPRPVVREEIAGVVEASPTPEPPVVQTTSSGWDGLPEAEAMAKPVMVPLAQGPVPMLPVTSLLPVRTARGDVVYMAPMQPILGGGDAAPGLIPVDAATTRWHATETTTTRTMTTETTRSGSETGRMTREEWELERKEKKKEKKEKKMEKKKEKKEKKKKKKEDKEDNKNNMKKKEKQKTKKKKKNKE